MTNFKNLIDLPIYENLYEEMNNLMIKYSLNWNNSNQICLNSVTRDSDDVYLGTGSLTHDWHNSIISVSSTGEEKRTVTEKEIRYQEDDFKFLCKQFKGTLFEDVYNKLSEKYVLGRVRLMRMRSKTCLSWHVDSSIRIHYPIKTQEGCFMIIENEVKHLQKNTWWETNTLPLHTALNASKEDRIHLVAVVLK